MDYNFIFNDLKNTSVSDLTTLQVTDMRDFILSVTAKLDSNLTFNSILQRMLDNVPTTVDQRTGSIIYDALAPSAGEMAQAYIQLEIWKMQTYLLDAVGDDLDKIGEQYGLPRLQATQAYRLGEFTDTNDNLVNIPINSRFSVPESSSTITYYVKEYQSTGKPILICEQTGTTGNDYTGDILPLFSIDNLKTATITGTLQPAQDRENDDTYRARIIARINQKGFGGNIQDYKELFADEISGTSEPKVYPTWAGGGTVKISVLDSEYNPITNEFKQQIKEYIDPEEYTGQGVGTAPIGHKVTIDTPEKDIVNISADVTLEDVNTGQIQSSVDEYLEAYFLETRKTWVDYDTIRIFVSQVIANMLKVKGMQNVTNVKLNGQSEDLAFTSTAEKQVIPFLGTVTLNEV